MIRMNIAYVDAERGGGPWANANENIIMAIFRLMSICVISLFLFSLFSKK